MDINLDVETERFVQEKIKTGQYHSPDELVRDAIELLRLQDRLGKEDINELRAELQIGLNQLDRGEGEDWDVEQLKQAVREQAAKVKRAS